MIATKRERFAVMKPIAWVTILIAEILAPSVLRYTNMKISNPSNKNSMIKSNTR